MFVAINFISCADGYRERFEELFRTRAGAIDSMPGFQRLKVLRPHDRSEYLIMSEWDSEEHFKAWTKSEAFVEGHRRGFDDIKAAKERGEDPPMKSQFRTYDILTT
jgi:heme-degrading monooxygenase HmoA